MNSQGEIKNHTDLLQLDDFIMWCLAPTEEQDRRWLGFRQAHPELGDEIDKAIAVCHHIRISDHTYAEADHLFRRIRQSIAEARSRRRKLYRRLAAAASILIIVGAAIWCYTVRPTPHELSIVGTINPSQDVMLATGRSVTRLPGHAMLQLANGHINILDSTSQIKQTTLADAQYNKLVVPHGRRSSVILADGSKLWVNSGSEVCFPSVFDKQQREISVSGEVFIDVAKSPDHPFIVHTSAFDVVVRGTRFNLSAYDQDEEAAVVLVEGHVEVSAPSGSRIGVNPGEMARLCAGRLTKQHVDTSRYTSWVDGIYIFNKTPAAEVLRKLGKYYNISFNNTEAWLADEYICGKIYLSDNIDDVLTSVSLITSSTYTRSLQTIKLTKTKKEEEE